MKIAQSRLTAQGQISVPAVVRTKLGLRPGAVLEWEERGGELLVRRVGQYSTAEVHQALFGPEAPPASSSDVKQGIRAHVRQRHGRR
jgi:AbrB family looped-hinge helix DNA binding protein